MNARSDPLFLDKGLTPFPRFSIIAAQNAVNSKGIS